MELLKLCLIRRSLDTRAISLHRLVKLHVLRRLLSDTGRYSRIFLQALDLIRIVVPRISSTSRPKFVSEDRSIFEIYLPHIFCLDEAHEHCDTNNMSAEENLEYAGLLSDAGLWLLGRTLDGEVSLAEKLNRKVVKTRMALLGPESLDTLKSLANLASTYLIQGRFTEAEQLDLKVLEARKTLLGQDHLETLSAMADLSSTYQGQQRWEEAERLDIQVVDGMTKALGPKHPDTLRSLASLAATYQSQGRLKEAERLNTQVRIDIANLLGPELSDILRQIVSLTMTYQSEGRWDEAEDLLSQAIDGMTKVLGRDLRIPYAVWYHF